MYSLLVRSKLSSAYLITISIIIVIAIINISPKGYNAFKHKLWSTYSKSFFSFGC